MIAALFTYLNLDILQFGVILNEKTNIVQILNSKTFMIHKARGRGMTQKKAEVILAAAKKIFARYGPGKTTIEEIARMASVAKGTVYNYFGNKTQVYLKVLKQEADEILKKILSAVEKESSPRAKLAAFLRAKFKYMEQAANILDLDRACAENQIPEARAIRNRFFEQEVNIIDSILREGVRKKIFKVKNTLLTAKTIGHALRGFEHSWLVKNSNEQIDQYLSELLELFCTGMTIEGGTD